MRPRYYVHMGPRSAEKVSRFWKASHLAVFVLIVVASATASVCVYNILDMYKFNCILYAHVAFETSFKDRADTNITVVTSAPNGTLSNDTSLGLPGIFNGSTNGTVGGNIRRRARGLKLLDTMKAFDMAQKKHLAQLNEPKTVEPVIKVWRSGDDANMTGMVDNIETPGFLNMRKTIFATIYMCNLILFTPLTSAIVAVFLGALIMVGGKGGAGNPGDLLPNPWICVYPFLGLCAFMMVFSFVSNSIYHHGLEEFCIDYYNFTKVKTCSEKINKYTIQFTENSRGPEGNFFLMYIVGSYAVITISMLWLIQTCIYVMRILLLADFSLYLTTIKLYSDDKPDGKMAGVVMNLLDPKTKLK